VIFSTYIRVAVAQRSVINAPVTVITFRQVVFQEQGQYILIAANNVQPWGCYNMHTSHMGKEKYGVNEWLQRAKGGKFTVKVILF
jgi:hypothetical protein